MSISYKIIAYYTRDTPYEDIINNLLDSADEHGISYDIMGMLNRGSWIANVGLKPLFISLMLDKHDCDLLYIDADAIIKKYPVFLDNFIGDIGVYYLKNKELLSGTIYLRNNQRTKNLVDHWLYIQKTQPRMWDQKSLQIAIRRDKEIKVTPIPATYVQIFDIMKDAGEPVIEHFQASRRFKSLVKENNMKQIKPPQVSGTRVRILPDGSFMIPTSNPEAEAVLDDKCIRVKNELRWFPRLKIGLDIEDFRNIFDGNLCYIIGKGPSLDNLVSDNFEITNAPIIAINEAIHKVEELDLQNPIFCIQQDDGLKNTCLPKKGTLFISRRASHNYAIRNKIEYTPEQFSLSPKHLSVVCAIRIAKYLGCNTFELVCFDGCVDHNTEYAKCIGYESSRNGDPKRFIKHKTIIENNSSDITWTIPKDPELSSPYKQPLSSDSLEEHHDRAQH